MTSKQILRMSAASLCVLALLPARASAYIGGPPASLGMMCNWSTHVIQVRIEKLDKEKGIIVWRKLHDYKGKWPGGAELIKQNFASLPDRAYVMQWADVGKTTVMFALESYKWSHTYIDKLWCASTTADWQAFAAQHVEPIVLRTFCGRPDKLQGAVAAILSGNEVVISCFADGNPKDLALRKGKIQQFRASLKRLDYNAGRDFVSWGDDLEPLGMVGFSHCLRLGRLGPEAHAVSFADFDGDGNLDVCLSGSGRIALMQNSGGLIEIAVPAFTEGGRAAVWADYNADGLPDLLLAGVKGPKLYTNLGKGQFRDDSRLLPTENCYDVTAAAWIDYDCDGRPDLLLGNGFHGLRLYRNKSKADPLPAPAKPGLVVTPTPANLWFEDVSAQVGLGPDGIGGDLRGDTLTTCDVDGDGRPDFLYGAGSGLLVMNTPTGFVVAKNCGISYKPGKVGPAFADFDNSGAMSLFLPQRDGSGKLFKNNGLGHFTDVTAAAGDLAKPLGLATCAAWGDFDNDGHLDLIVGCLKGPNRLFRNKGDGTFTEATAEIGLYKRIFNTRTIGIVDLNHDGVLDIVLNNEGQDSVALLGDPDQAHKRTPATVDFTGTTSLVGARVRITDAAGKNIALREIGGSDGRGSQLAPQAHFALLPGNYRLEARTTSGQVRSRELTVNQRPVWITLADK